MLAVSGRKDCKGHGGEEETALQTTEISTLSTHRTSCVILTSVLTVYIASKPSVQLWRAERRNFFHSSAS